VERSPISQSANLLRVALSIDVAQVELGITAWELVGIHNSSVEYELGAPTDEPWPGHDNRPRQGGRAEVVAYLPAERWSKIELAARSVAARLLGSAPSYQVKRLPSRDWRTAWHDHFNLVRIPGSQSLIVRPPHIDYESKTGELVVDLVPGLAFGTGQHQSTRLCLGFLADQIHGGERVLDVGAGSGILAVAAARLGAASVLATDIDPLAVDAARQTVRQNQLGALVEVREGSVPTGETFDLVTANLTADILQYLANDLARALRSGGMLIASGLVASRQEEVAATLTTAGLRLISVRAEDDWRALLCALSA